MNGEFGSESSCISLPQKTIYIMLFLLSSNSNHVYYKCKMEIIIKQNVINANILHLEWINNKTIIARCDKGNELYLSGLCDITDLSDFKQISTLIMYDNSDKVLELTEQKRILIYISLFFISKHIVFVV
eukprot:182652_1